MANGENSSIKVSDDSVTKKEEGGPQNVGKTITRGGEDVSKRDGKEAGRQDTGVQGATQRPTGTSTMRDQTGIDPQDPEDKDSD